MRFFALTTTLAYLGLSAAENQAALLRHASTTRNISIPLFTELEELARIVDISYCVGLTSLGINKPFSCLSRCKDFPRFELVTTWNTGPLLSDSCGYIALDHGKERVIVAFRGTYSIVNTVVDLSTVPQEYVPYPGDGDGGAPDPPSSDHVTKEIIEGMSGQRMLHRKRSAEQAKEPKCTNCTVHLGFHTSWLNTRHQILPDLERQLYLFPHYKLNLVGHSLGGAVAALAGLDLLARGYDPTVTTFGEPRAGNKGLVKYIDERFGLDKKTRREGEDVHMKYRRVTHIDDPVPLLPLTEWGYAMHAGEIYISKPALSPDLVNLQHCIGDNDPSCIAGQDSTATSLTYTSASSTDPAENEAALRSTNSHRKRTLLDSVKEEVQDVKHEPWGIPSRYKLWQLFFAHRDYFWRLGLCVPGGDPLGGGRKYGMDGD